MAVAANVRKGGSWLLEETEPASVFTPEKLSEEHRLMAQTVEEFVTTEVMPQLDQLETKDWNLARNLVHRAGELGLLGISVPEQYGGLDLDKVSALVVSERIARSASMAAAYGAQANLTIIPIVLFGTDAQKAKYLPGLVSGEKIGAYALSESGSGSDALAARTRATRQADGSWLLNGEKMWITNGGFADVFIVFAQADGDQFTAFIVERAFGVKSGNEEHKMGLHGSSTTPILLQDVKVPADNLLGEIGKGHKVALNTLNFGRFKLGAMCSGGCRAAIGEAAKYAKQRKQFGHPIADFGAVKYKLGEMTARTYALESLMYRTAGLIDLTVAEGGGHGGSDIAAALEEFAVEASIAKVMGSETLDYVLDENVQIHGGNGFVKDYPAERTYRDARVNRIFEGTNEINRMLIPGMLIRRALKGEIGLIPAAKRLQDELLSPTGASLSMDEGLDADLRTVASFKKVALIVLGTAMQTYGSKLSDEQEVLCAAADILIDTYAAESAVLRAREAVTGGRGDAALHEAAARTFVNDASQRIQASAVTALAAMAEGDTLRTLLAALRRVLKPTPVNTVALRRTLADATVARGSYSVGVVLFARKCAGARRTRPTLHIALLIAASTYACTSGPPPPDEDTGGYIKEVEGARAEKDRVYGADPQTIPAEKRAIFLPLKYYAVDPALKVPAALRLSKDRPVFDMPTSTGTNRKMQRVGVLEFTLQGTQMSLAAFVEDGTQQITSLFVPFADLTTGMETYSAGRYLDLPPTATGFYVIDFNRAYNPTCAYNPTWECPFPPAENRLKVAIRAGEKAPPEAAAKASGA